MNDVKLVAEQYMLLAINILIQGISWKMGSLRDMEKILKLLHIQINPKTILDIVHCLQCQEGHRQGQQHLQKGG